MKKINSMVYIILALVITLGPDIFKLITTGYLTWGLPMVYLTTESYKGATGIGHVYGLIPLNLLIDMLCAIVIFFSIRMITRILGGNNLRWKL